MLLKFVDVDRTKQKYEMIKRLLVVNEYDDEYFLSEEFWSDNVDRDVSTALLHMVVYKDINSLKKKVLNPTP